MWRNILHGYLVVIDALYRDFHVKVNLATESLGRMYSYFGRQSDTGIPDLGILFDKINAADAVIVQIDRVPDESDRLAFICTYDGINSTGQQIIPRVLVARDRKGGHSKHRGKKSQSRDC